MRPPASMPLLLILNFSLHDYVHAARAGPNVSTCSQEVREQRGLFGSAHSADSMVTAKATIEMWQAVSLTGPARHKSY